MKKTITLAFAITILLMLSCSVVTNLLPEGELSESDIDRYVEKTVEAEFEDKQDRRLDLSSIPTFTPISPDNFKRDDPTAVPPTSAPSSSEPTTSPPPDDSSDSGSGGGIGMLMDTENPANQRYDLTVLYTEDFTSLPSRGWPYTPSRQEPRIQSGNIVLEGTDNWETTLFWTGEYIQKGQGIFVIFKYTQDVAFEIKLEEGDWLTDDFWRWGIYIHPGWGGQDHAFLTNIYEGVEQVGLDPLSGNLITVADRYYCVLIALESDSTFSTYIWQKSNPNKTLQYSQRMARWPDDEWRISFGGQTGSFYIDSFALVDLGD